MGITPRCSDMVSCPEAFGLYLSGGFKTFIRVVVDSSFSAVELGFVTYDRGITCHC